MSTIGERTCADEILLALVRKLDGKLTPVRKKKLPAGAAASERGAAPFKLTKRPGRPGAENAIADAAAQLVDRRGEQRVKSEAVKRQRSTSAPPCPRIKSEYPRRPVHHAGQSHHRAVGSRARGGAPLQQPLDPRHPLQPLQPLRPMQPMPRPPAGDPVLQVGQGQLPLQRLRCDAGAQRRWLRAGSFARYHPRAAPPNPTTPPYPTPSGSPVTNGLSHSLQPSLLPLHALQVGGAAVWAIKCQGRCGEAVPPLKTSASLYGDDVEINHQINFATSSCANSAQVWINHCSFFHAPAHARCCEREDGRRYRETESSYLLSYRGRGWRGAGSARDTRIQERGSLHSKQREVGDLANP